jgi:hypothetical protein
VAQAQARTVETGLTHPKKVLGREREASDFLTSDITFEPESVFLEPVKVLTSFDLPSVNTKIIASKLQLTRKFPCVIKTQCFGTAATAGKALYFAVSAMLSKPELLAGTLISL